MGVTGVGLATILSCASNMIFICLCAWKVAQYPVEPIPTAEKGNTFKTLMNVRDVKIYLEVGVPSMVMLCADWFAYEGIVIIAASISTAATGATAIALNYFSLILRIPCGF